MRNWTLGNNETLAMSKYVRADSFLVVLRTSGNCGPVFEVANFFVL